VAITEIGPSAAGATQALIEALPESALDEQLHEIFALASIGEGAKSAGEALVKLYSGGDSSLRGPILYAIGKLKFRDAESLLMQIVSEETPLSATAAWALAKIKPDAPPLVKDAVERMRAQCQSENVFERAAAASALSDLSIYLEVRERQNLGVHLQSMLLDDSEQVQEAAAAAIVRLGGDGVPAVAVALENPELRFFALGITSAIGEPAAKLVPAIVELLDSGDSDLVQEAIFALAAIGSPSAVASGQILAILNESVSSEDEEARLHYAATYCLGRIGSLAGQGVLPRLKELSGSPDLMQATVAVWSILQIAPNDQEQSLNAVPLLMRALNSENQTVRLEATIALGDLGSIAEDAIPAIELVSEDDPVRTIRQAAKESLRRIQAE
jgi:HEAT repeat protein